MSDPHQNPPQTTIPSMFWAAIDHGVKLLVGAALAWLLLLDSRVNELERRQVDYEARYSALRERTDEANRQLASRLDALQTEMRSLNNRTSEVANALARIEGRLGTGPVQRQGERNAMTSP